MHFLETYLAAILYLQLPGGIVISPGSIVLFSGKLVMLLLVYIREDAAAVRQPIYGLLIGNFLMVALVFTMRFHDVASRSPTGRSTSGFMDEMGGLMIWGTILLFIDSILIILLYERSAAWFGERQLPRIILVAGAGAHLRPDSASSPRSTSSSACRSTCSGAAGSPRWARRWSSA